MKRAFSKRTINKYFKELSIIMKNKGIEPCNILLVGGAVLALGYNFNRLTEDIDVCIKTQNPQLYNCCLELAKHYNLEEDWINGAVMRSPSFSPRLFDKAYLYKTYNNILNIYMIADIDLFCMKLVSYRNKDYRDLKEIVRKLRKNKVTHQDIINSIKYLYGSTYMIDNIRYQFISRYIKINY